jgi:hypothetical protein
VKINKANSHLNGGQAVELLNKVEKNPIPFETTTNVNTSGEVSVNVCFPVTISNTFEVEGETQNGLTCKDTAILSFSVNLS